MSPTLAAQRQEAAITLPAFTATPVADSRSTSAKAFTRKTPHLFINKTPEVYRLFEREIRKRRFGKAVNYPRHDACWRGKARRMCHNFARVQGNAVGQHGGECSVSVLDHKSILHVQ